MTKKPPKKADNPYKVLYWMGGALVLLALGVVALVMLMPKPATGPKDPERTMLWIYDDSNPKGPAAVAIIEESRSKGTLIAVPFPAPADALAAYDGSKSRRAQDLLATQLDRKIHNRVFLSTKVVGTLINASGGIKVEGTAMRGDEALAFIRDGGDQSAYRAMQVMLAMADSVAYNGVNMSISEGLALARQVDTNMDLMAIPDVIGRWGDYATVRVEQPVNYETATLSKFLMPDPKEEKQ